MHFAFFIAFVIGLRLLELLIAKRNARWLLQQGAVEYGREHYPLIVALHSSFIAAMMVEYYLTPAATFRLPFFLFFLVLIGLKGWVISSLGKYWNTRIYRIAHLSLISKGPYKYIKHPNYVIVVLEIAVIPLVFGLYYTAVVFTLLNAIMLYVRISVENSALAMNTSDTITRAGRH